MKTRYRILFDGNEYKVQIQRLNAFWWNKFGKIKRFWVDAERCQESFRVVRLFDTIDDAKKYINVCKESEVFYAKRRKNIFNMKKLEKTGWKKVWP